jgi:hypothetical protein
MKTAAGISGFPAFCGASTDANRKQMHSSGPERWR